MVVLYMGALVEGVENNYVCHFFQIPILNVPGNVRYGNWYTIYLNVILGLLVLVDRGHHLILPTPTPFYTQSLSPTK